MNWISLLAFTGILAVSYAANPVILLPGFGGSRLRVKLDNAPNMPHFFCTKNTNGKFENAWINFKYFLPEYMDCFAAYMTLHHNAATGASEDAPGVTVKPYDFGNTSSIEWLADQHITSEVRYFNMLVDQLVKELHLVRGHSIRGAPYDWRRAPNENGEYFRNLKALIEETSQINGGQKVTMLAHSMGNLMTWYFLQQQTQAWKDQYVKNWVAISGPFTGAVKMLAVETFAADYEEYFTDSANDVGLSYWKSTKALLFETAIQGPGVEVHCVNSKGVDTIKQLKFKRQSDFPDGTPERINGDGDGSVNIESLRACPLFAEDNVDSAGNKKPVHHVEYDGVTHTGIMLHQPALDYMKKAIKN